jgi:hypothetical protein
METTSLNSPSLYLSIPSVKHDKVQPAWASPDAFGTKQASLWTPVIVALVVRQNISQLFLTLFSAVLPFR